MRHSAKDDIEKVFRQVIDHKSIDKVRVTEVCDLCSINRQTFYNHFTGLLDIFKGIFKRELLQVIDNQRTLETWHGGFLATMDYLKANTSMMLHVYQSSYRLEVSDFFTEVSSELMGNVMDQCLVRKNIELDPEDSKFIINFYRYVFNGLMMDWVNDGMKEEPEVLLRKLQIMLDGSIIPSIEAFADRERHLWL